MERGAVVEQREQFCLESGRDRESWNERMEKVMDYGLRLVKGVNEEGGRDGVESDGLWARPGARKEWGMLAELVQRRRRRLRAWC